MKSVALSNAIQLISFWYLFHKGGGAKLLRREKYKYWARDEKTKVQRRTLLIGQSVNFVSFTPNSFSTHSTGKNGICHVFSAVFGILPFLTIHRSSPASIIPLLEIQLNSLVGLRVISTFLVSDIDFLYFSPLQCKNSFCGYQRSKW